MASTLHIIAPGICGPLAETQSIKNNALVKQWVKTLSRAQSSPDADSVNKVITDLFDIDVTADFPGAALNLLANERYSEDRYYLHADPVHLRAELDHAVLTPAHDLAVSEEEAERLCEAVNTHFAEDGLAFFRLDANRWFVSSDNEIHLTTTPLDEAIGRNVNFILPAGENATQWKQVLTESQMLLHNHAVNTTRENSGQQTLNSLWLYGCGTLPVVNKAISSISSSDDLFSGLAKCVDCDFIVMPHGSEAYIEKLAQQQNDGVNVLHLSQLQQLTNYTDVNLWLQQLEQVLQQWLYPLIRYCNKNNISLILHPCDGKQYQFSKFDAVKFWRAAAVQDYVSHY